MARLGSTGNIRVWWVPTLASISAPSAATITAGVDLTPALRRDGLTTPRSGATIDASDAASRQGKTAPGNIDPTMLTLKFHRDSVTGTDVQWTTLVEDTPGYIVVRRFGGSSVAAAAAQKCEVYQGSIISREMQQIGDETQNFVATMSVETSNQDAVMGA